jgi:RNA-dependent RNA polymerase
MPVWIKCGLKLAKERDKDDLNQNGRLLEISFGYLQSNRIYSWHKSIIDNSLLTWQTNIDQNYLAVQHQRDSLLQLRFTSNCLDNYFIISTTYARTYMMILPLRVPPKCYAISTLNGSKTHLLKLTFDVFDQSCLSDSSAISLKFADESSLLKCANAIERLMKLDRHRGYIECVPMSSPTSNKYQHRLFDFWSNYAYQALLSLGHRIKHRITSKTFQKIRTDSYISRNEEYANHSCYLKLMTIYHQAQQNRFFDINQEYDRVPPVLPSIVLDKWIYVPRVYLTPYGIFPLPVKPMRGNRILREKKLFGPNENFCRVLLRDIDFGAAREEFIKGNTKWIKDLIVGKEHLCIGGQQFQFLLFSNSQLKDRSFWFHSPYLGCTAENIRQWMGDCSHETCIGTYIARKALTLTSTTASIKVITQ